MTARPAVVAAFDFDGTLTTCDSVVPFLERLMPRRRIVVGLARRAFDVVPALARRDRDRLRSIATDVVFRGTPADDVSVAASTHGDAIFDGRLRDDTVGRLRWHLEHGHLVVFVSASYADYLDVVAHHLGVEHVLGTRLEIVDGRCTGRLDGPNCRGAEKVARLEHWLCEQDLTRDAVTVYAYGDSAGDDEMLAWADHPLRVDAPIASVAPTA